MATYNNFHITLKKWTHIETFGNEKINTSIFKPMLKSDTSINSELIITKFAKLNINYKQFSEEYKFQIFYTYLMTIIFIKYNICYERYLQTYNKKNKYKKNSCNAEEKSNKENIKDKKNLLILKIIIIMRIIEIILISIMILII